MYFLLQFFKKIEKIKKAKKRPKLNYAGCTNHFISISFFSKLTFNKRITAYLPPFSMRKNSTRSARNPVSKAKDGLISQNIKEYPAIVYRQTDQQLQTYNFLFGESYGR